MFENFHRKQEMDVQTVTMLSWAYATSAPYNKDLFATFCDVALEQRQQFHIRVRTRQVCSVDISQKKE